MESRGHASGAGLGWREAQIPICGNNDEMREARKFLRIALPPWTNHLSEPLLAELKQGKLSATEFQRYIAFDFIPPGSPAGGLGSGE